MRSEIELHDSTVLAIVRDGEDLIVRFSPAYIHKSAGRPGFDEGTVWTQEATLSFKRGNLSGALSPEGADIFDGKLTIGAVEHSNAIPVPLETNERVMLHMVVTPVGQHLAIVGEGARLELIGDPEFVEDFIP